MKCTKNVTMTDLLQQYADAGFHASCQGGCLSGTNTMQRMTRQYFLFGGLPLFTKNLMGSIYRQVVLTVPQECPLVKSFCCLFRSFIFGWVANCSKPRPIFLFLNDQVSCHQTQFNFVLGFSTQYNSFRTSATWFTFGL